MRLPWPIAIRRLAVIALVYAMFAALLSFTFTRSTGLSRWTMLPAGPALSYLNLLAIGAVTWCGWALLAAASSPWVVGSRSAAIGLARRAGRARRGVDRRGDGAGRVVATVRVVLQRRWGLRRCGGTRSTRRSSAPSTSTCRSTGRCSACSMPSTTTARSGAREVRRGAARDAAGRGAAAGPAPAGASALPVQHAARDLGAGPSRSRSGRRDDRAAERHAPRHLVARSASRKSPSARSSTSCAPISTSSRSTSDRGCASRSTSTARSLDALVPNLVLQPLAENALRHGLAPLCRGRHAAGRRPAATATSWCCVVTRRWPRAAPPGGRGGHGVGLSNTRARSRAPAPRARVAAGGRASGGGVQVTSGCRYRGRRRRLGQPRGRRHDPADPRPGRRRPADGARTAGQPAGAGARRRSGRHLRRRRRSGGGDPDAAAPDLVFLDMQMPELDGLAVVETVGVDRMPLTIFVTAYDEYAVRAFDAQAIDYLLKPFARPRFQQALDRARRHLERQRRAALSDQLLSVVASLRAPAGPGPRLMVKSGGRIVFVDVEQHRLGRGRGQLRPRSMPAATPPAAADDGRAADQAGRRSLRPHSPLADRQPRARSASCRWPAAATATSCCSSGLRLGLSRAAASRSSSAWPPRR